MPRWSSWWVAAIVLLLGAPLPAQTSSSVLEALALAQQADGSWGQTHGDGPAALRDPSRLVTIRFLTAIAIHHGRDAGTWEAWRKATVVAIAHDHAGGFLPHASPPRAPDTAEPGLRGLDPRVAANVVDWLTLSWGRPPLAPSQVVAPAPPSPPSP